MCGLHIVLKVYGISRISMEAAQKVRKTVATNYVKNLIQLDLSICRWSLINSIAAFYKPSSLHLFAFDFRNTIFALTAHLQTQNNTYATLERSFSASNKRKSWAFQFDYCRLVLLSGWDFLVLEGQNVVNFDTNCFIIVAFSPFLSLFY